MKIWCEYCEQPFTTDPYYWGTYKFCSERCKEKFIDRFRDK